MLSSTRITLRAPESTTRKPPAGSISTSRGTISMPAAASSFWTPSPLMRTSRGPPTRTSVLESATTRSPLASGTSPVGNRIRPEVATRVPAPVTLSMRRIWSVRGAADEEVAARVDRDAAGIHEHAEQRLHGSRRKRARIDADDELVADVGHEREAVAADRHPDRNRDQAARGDLGRRPGRGVGIDQEQLVRREIGHQDVAGGQRRRPGAAGGQHGRRDQRPPGRSSNAMRNRTGAADMGEDPTRDLERNRSLRASGGRARGETRARTRS